MLHSSLNQEADTANQEVKKAYTSFSQSTLDMTSVRSSVLKEHCAMMLEIMFYHDDQLLANSAYTVFPLVDILLNRNSRPLEEPLLRCLQYLCEEKRAVTNMSQCPG